MKKYIFVYAISVLTGCSSMPSKNYLSLKEKESTAYHTTSEAIKFNTSIDVTTKKELVSFSKQSPLVKTPSGLSTFQKITFEKNNSTGRFLVFSAKNHVIGYLKNGYVIPEIEFYDKVGAKLKSVLVQFGENTSCQIGRCLITTFDISQYPSGKITAIVMAKSAAHDKPFLSKQENLTQFAGGVFLNQNYAIEIYADFFGDAEIHLAGSKPLSAEVGGHAIFYQK